MLKPKANRSKKFLQEKTGLYHLSPKVVMPRLDIWAFELKISNWKRALFQALQYKAFANYSLVVFPFEKEGVLIKQLELFKELNVGILLFDATKEELKFLLHPQKEKSSSKWHTLFTLGQLVHQYSSEKHVI